MVGQVSVFISVEQLSFAELQCLIQLLTAKMVSAVRPHATVMNFLP